MINLKLKKGLLLLFFISVHAFAEGVDETCLDKGKALESSYRV